MLDRTEQTAEMIRRRRRMGGYVLPIAYFGGVGLVMIAWVAAIGWVGLHLISWIVR